MSDAVQGAVGKALRAARESRGMSVEDAATRLRLMHRQIDAMESEDFSSLGQPVFARGFVRNYARLLGLDPEPLLAGMAGAPEDAAPVAHVAAPAPAHWLTSPWILMLMLGTLLAVALPIALYWWLNSDAGEEVHVTSNVLPVPAEPRPVAAPTHAPLPAAQPPAATATAPFVAETALKTPAAAEAATPPAPAGDSALHLDFGGDAWVEIKDATGRVLLRQLKPSGSSVDLKGRPPFELVIGNAAQVRLSYNNRPIDLAPFIDVTVARFTLEE